MAFVSLEQTLEGIAGRVQAPEEIAEHPDLVEAWKYSEAAAAVHQLFHNRPKWRPRWMTLHKITGKAIIDDAVGLEGLELLAYVAGWYKRQLKFHADHVAFSSRAGRNSAAELASTAHQRKYEWGKVSRAHDIGFDRVSVVRFLVGANVAFSHRLGDDQSGRWHPASSPQQSDPKPKNAGAASELPNQTAKRQLRDKIRAAPQLTLPAKSDAWAKAIEATYKRMVQEKGSMPSGLEVWLRMNHKPPANFPITVTKDHGLAAIALPGEKLLTREGFMKRWSRYTADK